jgi:hypothetical protein
MRTVLVQFLLFTAVFLGSVSVAAAQWTTVGSAGTVDEADLADFDTAVSQIRIRSTATVPATVVVRYNVVRAEGIGVLSGLVMDMRYRDNGSAARVRTALKQVHITTGVTTTLLTMDSNAFPPSAAFQTQSAEESAVTFDFAQHAYFIETTLTKSATDGTPALEAIRLISGVDC